MPDRSLHQIPFSQGVFSFLPFHSVSILFLLFPSLLHLKAELVEVPPSLGPEDLRGASRASSMGGKYCRIRSVVRRPGNGVTSSTSTIECNNM